MPNNDFRFACKFIFIIFVWLVEVTVLPCASYCLTNEAETAYPYIVDENGTGQRLHLIRPQKGRIYNEAWLQELIRSKPEILPVADIDVLYHPFVPIGREVKTVSGGRIDNLFISRNGHLILVETKLWDNPEAKREVVAQVIDYAASFSKWTYEKLDTVTKAYTRKYEGAESGLAEWVEKRLGLVNGDPSLFKETVTKNLRLGRFLAIVVSDKIRTPVIEMIDYVNNYPGLAVNFALIELQGFWTGKDANWPVLLVPRIVSRTEIVERSVIEVTVNQEGIPDISITQNEERIKNEQDFWNLLKKNFPQRYEKAKKFIDEYRGTKGAEIAVGKSSLHIKLNIKGIRQRKISPFFINKKGECCVWPVTISEQLFSAGFDPSFVEGYEATMRSVLNMPENRTRFSSPVEHVDFSKFKSAVDEFMKNIRRHAEFASDEKKD